LNQAADQLPYAPTTDKSRQPARCFACHVDGSGLTRLQRELTASLFMRADEAL
jgi:hypothetical protein